VIPSKLSYHLGTKIYWLCTMCDIFIKLRYHLWYLFKPQGAHLEMYKTTGVYIGKKKKMCLSNKHLVIFWVISIGHANYCVCNCYTGLIVSFFFFFYKGSILVNMLFWYTIGIQVTFGSKQACQIYQILFVYKVSFVI
jgi:hypothetical protein